MVSAKSIHPASVIRIISVHIPTPRLPHRRSRIALCGITNVIDLTLEMSHAITTNLAIVKASICMVPVLTRVSSRVVW